MSKKEQKEIIQDLCRIIAVEFSNPELLIAAITHPSLHNQEPINSKSKQVDFNYERLEFLGDKVLSMIIANYLIKNYPNDDEGSLSKRHASLVCGEILAKIAVKIQLPSFLRISLGEKKLGGDTNKNNLENALEALIGAIYLDSGFENASQFVLNFWQDFLQQDLLPPQDPISALQELVQSKTKKLPIYQTSIESGPAHAPIFVSRLAIPSFSKTSQNSSNRNDDSVGDSNLILCSDKSGSDDVFERGSFTKTVEEIFEAKGNSKKEAQRNVAILALERLKQNSSQN